MTSPQPGDVQQRGPAAPRARRQGGPGWRSSGARLVLRWFVVVACVAAPWALLAADALPGLHPPLPRWAVRGLFTAYIGGAVLGVSAYVLLWSGAGRLGRTRTLNDQARLAPGAARWLSLELALQLLAELLPPILGAQLLWVVARGPVPVSAVAGLHAFVLGMAMALAVMRAWIEQQVGGSRAAVGALAVTLAVMIGSALWVPPLMPAWLGSRVYGPVLVACNPLLAAAAAAKVDLVRHGLWYGLSPLGTTRFSSPPALVCALMPFATTVGLGLALRQFRFRVRTQ